MIAIVSFVPAVRSGEKYRDGTYKSGRQIPTYNLENYSLEGLLSSELTFTSMPKENVLRTLYTLRLYPALKSSERVRL